MFYEQVIGKLNNKKVRYVIIGGIAINLQGVPRATADLDLMVDLEEKNLSKLISALKEMGFQPKAPVNLEDMVSKEARNRWIKEKDAKVLSLYNKKAGYQEIDILLENPVSFDIVYLEKDVLSLGRYKIPLASIDNLIKIKKKASRKQDIDDIEALKKVKKILKENEKA